MLKMIVSSFYNTLIDTDEAISTSTMLEIERIRNKGIIFAVCTNRLVKDVLEYNKDFPFLDYIIALNGSYIYDVLKQRCIYKKKIPNSTVKKISKLFEEKSILYYTANDIYNNYTEIENQEIYKIEVELEDMNDDIIQELKKIKINISTLNINNKTYLELNSHQATMFTGADQIALKNNLTLNDILAICGNESDFSLISNISNSYIVKNNCKKLLEKSKKITISKVIKEVESILKKI